MLELERLAEQRRHEEEAWQRQQELLLSAEEQRKKMLELEEQKLSDQRARLAAMKREARIKELKSLDEARRRYLEQQQGLREKEISKMDKEIERKASMCFWGSRDLHVIVRCCKGIGRHRRL